MMRCTTRLAVRHSISLLASMLLLGLTSHGVRADDAHRVLALLIGVSEYPSLAPDLQLDAGPRNDVVLFAEYLKSRHVPDSNVRILSENVPAGALPTRQEILASLSQLASQAQHGDRVVLLFSGHGSQQPSKDDARIEPDGLDQIFLPRDVGRWDGQTGVVRNAISDNEIGSAIDHLRARGAFVWAIFDTCHAGTLARGALSIQQARSVLPDRLGIPQKALTAAANRPALPSRDAGNTIREQLHFSSASTPGGYVALFASQREEIATQMRVRSGVASNMSYGRFSYTLVQALRSSPNASYRQAMEQVLLSYQGMGVVETTPGYEGTTLDAPVLEDTNREPGSQWPVYETGGHLMVEAGLLQRVTADSILQLVSSPTAQADEIAGYARVVDADAIHASIVSIEHNHKPPVSWSSGKAEDSSRAIFYARPLDLKVAFTMRVAAPAKGSGCDAPGTKLLDAIATMRRSPQLAPRVVWVATTDDADIRLCQRQGQLTVLDAAGAAIIGQEPTHLSEVPVRESGSATVARELGTTLDRIGRVQNLYRVAAGYTQANRLIDVTVERCRRKAPPSEKCDPEATIDPAGRPVLHAADRLDIRLRNFSWEPVNVTVLYINAACKITPLFPDPQVPQEHARIPARSSPVVVPIELDADPAGFERVLVIAVPARSESEEMSFVHLAQDGAVPVDLRGGSGNALMDLMNQAVLGTQMRGGHPVGGDITPQFASFGWIVTPGGE
jgi:hypothetical protein